MKLTRDQIERLKADYVVDYFPGVDEFIRLCDLAIERMDMEPTATHRHIKTGGDYQKIGDGRIQTTTPLNDMQSVVIYRSMKDGSLWAREELEFNDVTRFRSLSALTKPKGV